MYRIQFRCSSKIVLVVGLLISVVQPFGCSRRSVTPVSQDRSGDSVTVDESQQAQTAEASASGKNIRDRAPLNAPNSVTDNSLAQVLNPSQEKQTQPPSNIDDESKSADSESDDTQQDDIDELTSDEDPPPPGAVVTTGSTQFRHPRHVRWIAMGPNNKRLFSVAGNELFHWDAATGKPIFRVKIDELKNQYPTAHSPDFRLLAATDYKNRKVQLWELASGRTVRVLKGFQRSGHTPQGI